MLSAADPVRVFQRFATVDAISGGRNAAGILVSVLVTTGLVYLVRRSRGGTLTDPGLGARR